MRGCAFGGGGGVGEDKVGEEETGGNRRFESDIVLGVEDNGRSLA